MSNSILFMDVDGVLNTTGRYFSTDFNPAAMANLKKVLDSTGAKVMVVSQWRLDPKTMGALRSLLAKFGIDPAVIKGGTNQIDLYSRNKEIRQILLYTKPPYRFAIVDDEPRYYGNDSKLKDFAVFTDPKKGITEDIADRLIEILARTTTNDILDFGV